MNTLLAYLSGKSRYLIPLVIGVLLFGVWQHWWNIPSEIYVALLALELGFLRASNAQTASIMSQAQPVAITKGNGMAPNVPLMLLLILPALLLSGCGAIPKDVAHVVDLHAKGLKVGLNQNPVTQIYEAGIQDVDGEIVLIPIVWETNDMGQISAVIPPVVVSHEINGRNTIFGGAGETFTMATGTNAVETTLGGQHAPINEASGTNIPK